MAEPADTFCIVIDAATVAGTSFSIVLSRFPSLLQNFLDLFLLYSIRAVPEMTKLINWWRDESFNTLICRQQSSHSYASNQGQRWGDEPDV